MNDSPTTPAPPSASPTRRPPWRALIFVALLSVGGIFITVTPPGPADKLDAFGYAVCHRLESHSFLIGGRPMPLCARCTGIFMGAAFVILTLIASGRARYSQFPQGRVLIVLLGFIALMGLDGANSYAGFFHGLIPQLYDPQNWLRLITGTLDGIAMGLFILPLFSALFWRDIVPAPIIGNLRELAALVLMAALLDALVLSEAPLVLWPLAALSALGVVLMLTLVNTSLALILTRQENRVAHLRDGVTALAGGLTLALSLITVIDIARFALTGTWGGFPL